MVLGYVSPLNPVAFPPAPELNDSGSKLIQGVHKMILLTVAEKLADWNGVLSNHVLGKE